MLLFGFFLTILLSARYNKKKYDSQDSLVVIYLTLATNWPACSLSLVNIRWVPYSRLGDLSVMAERSINWVAEIYED